VTGQGRARQGKAWHGMAWSKINVGGCKPTDNVVVCRHLNQFKSEITNFVLFIK
jgi:hypothetical protein